MKSTNLEKTRSIPMRQDRRIGQERGKVPISVSGGVYAGELVPGLSQEMNFEPILQLLAESVALLVIDDPHVVTVVHQIL
jgi:predicted transcriptional regulator